MTQAEIAKELGVSQATVSYVLKGRGKVSDELRQKIMEKARKTGYAPRRQSGKSIVSVVVNKLLYSSTASCERYFIGLQEEAQKHGLSLSHYVWEPGKFAFESLNPDSAAYVLASISPDEADLGKFKDSKLPCVFLSRPAIEGWADTVLMDNADGVRKAIRHLWSQGHRRIGFYAISSISGNRAERYGAYHQALAELDALPPPDGGVFTPRRHEYTERDVKLLALQTMETWKAMSERPTALVCSADAEALAIIAAAKELGIRVPEELSVCGFDDSPEGLRASPQLDSVAQPLERMGQLAIQLIASRMADPSLPPRHWRAMPELRLRNSSACPPGSKS